MSSSNRRTDWKTLVQKEQAKTNVLPEGWHTREEVAIQLECSEDNVRRLLTPLIKAKEVQVGAFPVWDNVTKKVIRVTAYKHSPKAPRP